MPLPVLSTEHPPGGGAPDVSYAGGVSINSLISSTIHQSFANIDTFVSNASNKHVSLSEIFSEGYDSVWYYMVGGDPAYNPITTPGDPESNLNCLIVARWFSETETHGQMLLRIVCVR
jgi:hypothetical protein